MEDKEEKSHDSLDNSLNEDFPSDQEGLQSSNSEAELEEKRRRTESPNPHQAHVLPPHLMVAASPPKFFSLDQLMEAAKGVKNMALAHEIAVNSEFKLEKMTPPENSVEKTIKETMQRAFWDVLQDKLSQDPPDYSNAVVLIEEVKENLMALLLPQHVRLKAQIEEVLDLDLIKQKMENDAFDIHYYANYVIDIMAKLCAPVRDEQVAALRQEKDVVPLFKSIFSILDVMNMDMANFTIQQMRPYLQQQSVDYERAKFDEFLKAQDEAGVDGLLFTRKWLRRNFDKLTDVDVVVSQDGGAGCAPLVTPAAVLNESYIELLHWNEKELYPETLLMDEARFSELQQKMRELCLISSILLVTFGTVGGPIAGVQSLKEKLKSETATILQGEHEKDLSQILSNVAEQVNKSVNEYLTSHGTGSHDDSKQKLLIGQIKELSNSDHAVYKLMSKRVHDFIKSLMTSQPRGPLQVPAGFTVVERDLGQLCGKFLRLVSHNRSVFFGYYSDIINTLLKKNIEDLSPRG
ncbi:hypothetical protein FSP39_024473 [Pinctada imbricata]|uniref:T-complex protein 11-like protein 1 n=1 Tax=Pinctada imbricata TaxID=66713 RepID=A0AA89C2T1_PINIB|nr:hypothetical protein FSP39_024473 [Pinctada imbricata]